MKYGASSFSMCSRSATNFGGLLFLTATLATQAALAQVEVTETFDVGTGARFDLFLDNDVVLPRPETLLPDENPADSDLIRDAFGGERTFVDGNGNLITNHFGFTSTNHAGGQGVGEFGGEFNWLNYGGVADTTLGGEFNPSNELVIRAKMRLDDIGLENDQRILLGYYNLPDQPVAEDFSRGRIVAGIGFVGGARFLLQINGNNSDPINVPGGFDQSTGLTDQFDVDLTLRFDPNQGEMGLAWFEGAVAGIPINEFTFSNNADIGDSINSFAVAQGFLRESFDAYRRGVAWIDDLTYSAVVDQGIDTPNPPRIDAPGGPVLRADFNEDGRVDNLDLTDANLGWEARYGVDLRGDNLLAWQQELGSVAAAQPAHIAVPEPASAWLVWMALVILWQTGSAGRKQLPPADRAKHA